MRSGDYKNYYKGHMDKIKGEGGGGNGVKGEWSSRNMYKGRLDQAKEGRFEGGRRGSGG